MSHIDPAHDADDLARAGNGNSGGSSHGGALATIEPHLPAVQASGWSYGAPQKPEILTAKANPVELLHAIRRRWPLAIGLGLLVGGVGALLVAYFVPVNYEVYALLRVSGRQGGILDKGGEGIDQFAVFKRTQVQLILSPAVLNRTVQERKVNNLSLIRENDDDPVGWLKGKLMIDYPDDAEILRIAIKGRKEAELRAIVDTVVEKYMSEIVAREREKRLEVENKLTRSYEDYQKNLQGQMDALHTLELVNKTDSTEAAQVKKKLAQQKLADAMNMKGRLMVDLAQVEMDIATAQAREVNPEVGAAADFLIEQDMGRDPTVYHLAQKLAGLNEQLAYAKSQLTRPETNPRIMAFQQTIIHLQDELDAKKAELRPILIEMRKAEEEAKSKTDEKSYSLPVLEKQKQHIEKEIEKADTSIAEEAEVIESMEYFSSTVNAKKSELKRLENITIELGTQMERSKVERQALERITPIDKATLDAAGGDRMRKYVGVVFTFLLGFGGVVLGIAFWEFQRRRVNDVGQVNDGLGIKVIGELPSVSGRTWRRMRGGKGAAVLKALMAERIDGTRTTLIHTSAIAPPRVVMVTSAEPGEGKTTAASQLAASLARSGRRTVLVDADIRNPGAHRVFDIPLEPGLSELLRGEAERDAAIHPTRTPNLWLLPAGRCDLRSVQALSGSYLGSAIAALCVQFDYVVIDSGPVLKVADPLMVGQHVDAAVLSVLRDKSEIPKVYEACERLRSVGITVLGSVVNGVKDDVARHGVELLMSETA